MRNLRRKITFCLIIVGVCLLGGIICLWVYPTLATEATPPVLSFISPTPDDGATQTELTMSSTVNMTEADLKTFKWNWNGTDYVQYNDQLISMMNLDNVSALGDDATTAADVSIYGHNATITGGTWSAGTTGKYGEALNFDGADDCLTLPDVTSHFTAEVTTEATLVMWVKVNQPTDPNKTGLGIITGGGDNTHYPYSDGKIYLNFLRSSRVDNITPAVDLQQWHMLTITTTPGPDGYKVYQNLQNIKTTEGDATVSLPTAIILGHNQNPNYFDGSIDEFRLYNRALTFSEISELYQSNLAKITTSTWQYQNTETVAGDGAYTYQASATDQYEASGTTGSRTLNIGTPVVTRRRFVPSPVPPVVIEPAEPTITIPVIESDVQIRDNQQTQVQLNPAEGVSLSLSSNNAVASFTVNSESHDLAVTVVDTETKTVELLLHSAPLKVSLLEGETKEVDVDNDGAPDLKIFLKKIISAGEVNLVITPIAKPEPSVIIPIEEPIVSVEQPAIAPQPIEVVPQRGEPVNLVSERTAIGQYIKLVKKEPISVGDWQVVHFLAYGFPSPVKPQSIRDRAGVLVDYNNIYGHLPGTVADWQDVDKIIRGISPTPVPTQEVQAVQQFTKIYHRVADLTSAFDQSFVQYVAYGLRPIARSLNREQSALSVFVKVYQRLPDSGFFWSILRAIAYSGVTK